MSSNAREDRLRIAIVFFVGYTCENELYHKSL